MNKITFPLKLQMQRPEVADLQEALEYLGSNITDTEKTNQRFGASTRAAVTKFQTAHGLPATGEVDEATASAINGVLSEQGAFDPGTPDVPSPAGRQVAGTVLHADGSVISGMRVQAFHRRIGGETALGLAATNDRGKYTIPYQLPAGISKIDLFVRAYDDNQTIVAVSPIIIGAGEQEVLDLTVTDTRFRGPSEFARATAALGAQVAGVPLENLDANDVALLVRNTGISRESVTAWIASRRLAGRTGIEPESLHGLVRTEKTASLPRLLRRSASRLLGSLNNAAESNLISFAAGQRAQATVTQLRRLTVELSASVQTPGSLGQLLATCMAASPAQQASFIERYANHEGPVQALWAALRKDPAVGDAVVDDLQLSLQLGTLAANHPPLVKALRATGVQHASQTATLGAEGWQKLLQTEVDGKPVGTPANIKGATDTERQDNYIKLLMERSARAYPTAHIAKSLKALPTWQASTTVAFLDNNPNFNLLTANIKASLDAGTVVLRPEWERAKLESDLATVQRVARVAPRGQEEPVVNGLLAHGFTSALAISRHSRASFTRRTSAAFGDEATADAVHRNAQFQVARAGSAYALMHPFLGGGIIDAVGKFSEAVANDATWASLFGNVDYCSCEQCRSIHGPAAYLVDLLNWLDGHELSGLNPDHQTAFDRLNKRRPDIQRIELSCDNTNTILPYVDLVNEILEQRVLNPSADSSSGKAQVPTATMATSPEVLANPEYLNPQAYDDYLAEAVYPDLLPFDLWGELASVYFEHLGVRRSDLMEALRRQDARRDPAIDAERLRFSMAQWRILIGPAGEALRTHWGYPLGPAGAGFVTDLANVSNFLSRSGLEYEQLLDLLHTRFVNPGGIGISGTACNTDEMTIVGWGDGHTALGQAHRFLRLWRNRGWSMLELDKVLHALNISELTSDGLGRLADLDRVQELTRAPLLEILCWWGVIDTYADRPEKDDPAKPLYDRVFLNRAVDAAADQPEFPLALNATRDELAADPSRPSSAVSWDAVRTILQGALSIVSGDLALLLDSTVDGMVNLQRVVTGDVVSLKDLSALYRHVSLARSLELSVSELLGLLRLTSLDPFDINHTETTITFVEALRDIQVSPFSLVELHYLLEHDAQAVTSVGVTDDAIGQILVEMRDGLNRVTAEFAIASDPVGEIAARYLAVLLDADAVAAVMTSLRTEADDANRADLEAVLTDKLGGFFTVGAAGLIAVSVGQRFDALLKILAPYLQETQGNAVVIEKIAGFSGRGLDSAQDILERRLQMTVDSQQVFALDGLRRSPYVKSTSGEIAASDDTEAFATLRRIHKAALVLNKLGVDMDTQAWLFDVGVNNGLLNPLTLPVVEQAVSPQTWGTWARLVDLMALERDLPGGEPSLVELLQLLESADDPVVAKETFLTNLAARTGWLREDIDALDNAFSPTFPAGWRDGGILRTLVDAFALIGRLGVPAAQANGWAMTDIGKDEAEALRLAAKSKHDEDRWPAIARALRDPVREKQRAALVGYLIAAREKYEDEDDLFDDLLIDVEMAPCMLTSRLKQAISSVQLFVERAFLNLEQGVELTRDDQQAWEWMKNYRVWEAARKVFLYPENWIEPELRLDKSPLFEQLENTLLQGELDDVAAEKAYTEYLEGLLKIARVEVMGLYHQSEQDKDGTIDVLHVVARTKSQPYEYYYRQWVDSREWTAWEKLDADIDGNHVILAVHDRRLFLLWPVVEQKKDEVSGDFYEMKLAWIERMNEQWGARKLSVELLTVDAGLWEDDESSVFFRLVPGDQLEVQCLRNDFRDYFTLLGAFTFESCSGQLLATTADEDESVLLPVGQSVSRMRFESVLESNTREGIEFNSTVHMFSIEAAVLDSNGQATSKADVVFVLSRSHDLPDAAFSYAYPHQYGEYLSQHGVFLDDDERTFHVMPEPAFDWDQFSGTDSVEPSNVGTTDSASDSFEPQKEAPPFEPDIPWDKEQEPSIILGNSVARLTQKPGRQTALRAPALAAIATNAAMANTLTIADLQQSQSQLHEVAQNSDALASPQTTKYRFSLFDHPYVCDFMAELRRSGVSGLLDPNPDGPKEAAELVRQHKNSDFFLETYQPTSSVLNTPIEDIDFEIGGAYSKYNWEIFFHAPLLIAGRLSQNQRFDEARHWFHFMFDPTNRSNDADPLRFWKIKPFYRQPDDPIEQFLALAASADGSAEADAARTSYDEQIAAWLDDPFSPNAIAEIRTTAYQKTLVMKYLDNLVAWGDQLFRQDTIESINEATQLYVLALQLLGERPDALPPRSIPTTTTFEQVRASLNDSVLNNPLVQLESMIPQPSKEVSPISAISLVANSWANLLVPRLPVGTVNITSAVPSFYFCIPPNENLLAYWDTVEDRLFKIRHCMNIEGMVRQLPLFEPPIDPGMLVRARAAGIDLSSALADLSAPLPHYRFAVMLQKAYALNQTVRGLGSALLSALEKTDAEALAILRANQEVALLEAVREVKKLAIDEARDSLAAAEKSLDVVQQRHDYYAGLISSGWLQEEKNQKKYLQDARIAQLTAAGLAALGASVMPIPQISASAGLTPMVTTEIINGEKQAKALELLGDVAAATAAYLSNTASIQGITAGYARRAAEWQQQKDSADKEQLQIQKQIDAASVRVSLAERDLENHDRQIENARSVRDFMERKFTSVQLYQWMVGQLSSLFFQSYQLAYDLAKRAERGYCHELALPEATFIQFGYWDSLKKGLLAGERLQYDLERMDKTYLENNVREYEITQHVSLALLDPVALLQLQTAGSCEFSVPEALFDLDYPGHYLRRIKSVSVTVPCVTGPYTGVPMRLTLVSSCTRVDPNATNGYPMDPTTTDSRFQTQTGAVQSIAIRGGHDDAGLFVADHRDERYLPFEGRGAISKWNLKLTSAVPTFDWTTITDVVLHIQYTAREGGDLLRDAALKSLNAQLAGLPLRRAFSAKSEFPSEWNAFLRPPEGSSQAVLNVELSEQLFPHIAQDAGLRITNLELIALVKEPDNWRGADITITASSNVPTSTPIGSSPLYGGQPSGSVAYAGALPGPWAISIPIVQLGTPANWAEDLILIANYEIQLALN